MNKEQAKLKRLQEANAAHARNTREREIMSEHKNKPCPFCRATDDFQFTVEQLSGEVAVFCVGCCCEGPTAKSEQAAWDAWNRRAIAVCGGCGQEGEPLYADK